MTASDVSVLKVKGGSEIEPTKNQGKSNSEKHKILHWEFGAEIIWLNIILITVWHIIGIYGLLTHNYIKNPWILFYSLFINGLSGLGVTMGVHRLWTHRSYKAKLPVRIFLAACYDMFGMNSIVDWVRDHRVHHKYCDTNADPHNVRRGLFFAHMGWLMMKKHPDVKEKGKLIDCSDLLEDPVVRFNEKHFVTLKVFFTFILPTIIPPLLWGESWYTSIVFLCCIRYLAGLHGVWSVNSFAHLWGTRPYNKDIFPTENLSVSLFALGEGYHNYHHTFPWDYRTAEVGSRINITTFYINLFHKLGWVYDLKAPKNELIQKIVASTGDGTHYKWGHEVPFEDNKQFVNIIKKTM